MTTSDNQLPTTINEKLLPETSLHDTGQYFIDEYNWNFGHFAAFCDQLFGTRVTRKILEGLWCSHLKRICESDEDKQRRDQASSLLPTGPKHSNHNYNLITGVNGVVVNTNINNNHASQATRKIAPQHENSLPHGSPRGDDPLTPTFSAIENICSGDEGLPSTAILSSSPASSKFPYLYDTSYGIRSVPSPSNAPKRRKVSPEAGSVWNAPRQSADCSSDLRRELDRQHKLIEQQRREMDIQRRGIEAQRLEMEIQHQEMQCLQQEVECQRRGMKHLLHQMQLLRQERQERVQE